MPLTTSCYFTAALLADQGFLSALGVLGLHCVSTFKILATPQGLKQVCRSSGLAPERLASTADTPALRTRARTRRTGN